MMLAINNNNSSGVSWDLANVSEKEAGKNFIKSLCRYLPIYSSGARQIYSEGECHFTSDDRVVFLANTQDYTKTFSRIPPSAIINTGIFIFRDRNSKLLFLQKKKNERAKKYSFDSVVSQIIDSMESSNPSFIPVLQKSTVQNSSDKSPTIRISSLKVSELQDQDFSELDISLLKNHLKAMLIKMNNALSETS